MFLQTKHLFALESILHSNIKNSFYLICSFSRKLFLHHYLNTQCYFSRKVSLFDVHLIKQDPNKENSFITPLYACRINGVQKAIWLIDPTEKIRRTHPKKSNLFWVDFHSEEIPLYFGLPLVIIFSYFDKCSQERNRNFCWFR